MGKAGWTYTDHLRAVDQGKTVLDYYHRRYPHSSREAWQERILSGQILLNDQSVEPYTRLQLGQTLTYHRAPWQEPTVPLEIPILHQDEHLWAINKPAGLPVLPGGEFVEYTVLQQLKAQFPGEPLAPLHRLGRGTSGVLLLGRTSKARQNLNQQFRDHRCGKQYRAIVTGNQLPDRFTCDQPIGKVHYPQLGYLYAATTEGKVALSHGTVDQRRPEKSWVTVQIITGRPHQIRIHLAALGSPLWGDPLYQVGGLPDPQAKAIPSDCGYFLHAEQLTVEHPQTGEMLTIAAPLPTHWLSENEVITTRCRL